MALSLDNLPSTVLLRVCDYLDRDYTSSLLAFARVSKSCYSVATFLLFRTIRFSTRNNLAEDVQQCHDMLQRAAGFRCVRRLIVDGPWPPERSNELDPREQRRCLRISAEDRGYGNRIVDQVQWSTVHAFKADNTPATAVYETNEAWKPLASLIKQLHSLADLIYGCPSQFPPCLLEALHQHRPHCRLHINKFKLRSLNASSTDPYEVVLATSPCLHSISVQSDMQWGFITGEVQNFNYEAVQSMVAGLAPNLRELHIFHSSWGATFEGFYPCKPWKGFTPGSQVHSSSPISGSLRCLEIRVGDDLIGTQLIETWKAHTDFSVLERLKFESHIAQDTLECLTASSSFPSLRELVLPLANRQMKQPQTSEFYDIVGRFLCQLPPLSSLVLTGELSRLSMDSILEHQGAALRQLWLWPSDGEKCFLPEQIAKIGVHCPLLEDLSLTLCRSKGDAAEVASYRALGSIPKLQYISVVLDASNHTILGEDALAGFDLEDDDAEYPETPNDSSFDDFDQQFFKNYGGWRDPRNGHIRDAFINSAVDETLARAIFWAISSGKAVGSLPLEKLWIRVRGGGNFGNRVSVESVRCVSMVVAELGRSWLCERSPRDDSRQELITREQGPRGWETQQAQSTQQTHLPPIVEPIFRRLWPATQPAGDNWRNEWSSFPLRTLDT